MSLLQILSKKYDIKITPLEKFDLIDLLNYFEEDSLHYKYTRGLVAQMSMLVKKLDLSQEDKKELLICAHLFNIGFSKRVKNRDMQVLDSAIFALEQGFGETVSLALMFSMASFKEAKLIGGELFEVYNLAKPLFDENIKAQKYSQLITYCNLHTEIDGTPTSANRRIYKMLTRNAKTSNKYKNIKANKRYFKRLDKKIRLSVVKEKSLIESLQAIIKLEE